MDVTGAIARLRRDVAGELRADPGTRELYAVDAGLYYRRPAAALRAGATDDLAAAVEVCRAYGVPLTMRGAGTSLAGQAVGSGLVIDVGALDAIVIDPDRRRARVGPGAILADLNRAAARHGLTFGPDVATADRATLGGMIANNSAGARSVAHGQTSAAVRSLGVVLGTGTAARLGADTNPPPELAGCVHLTATMPTRTLLRRASGYALDALGGATPAWHEVICGSEGTLALITDAELALTPLPQTRGLAVIEFGSMFDALDAVVDLLDTDPSAIELLDRRMLDRGVAEQATGAEHSRALLVEYSGARDDVGAALNALAGVATVVDDPDEQERIWAARRAGIAWAVQHAGRARSGREPRPIPFIEDPAVPPHRLASFARALAGALDDEGTEAIWYGHASVGCLHVRPIMDLRDRTEVERMRRLAERVAGLVVEHDGSLSGEHGDGRVRSELLPLMYPPTTLRAFGDLKAALDPDGVLNPGVIVDPDPLDRALRAAEAPPITVDLAGFAREGGVGLAARACNGSARCRVVGGAMCPSFQALGDERHSTRGRAVLFRAALEGRLPGGLSSARLDEALELCLSCKACARECPAAVDMAWMKSVARDRRHRSHGTPLSARLQGATHELLAVASRVPGAAGPLVGLASRRLGRDLPRPTSRWRPARRSGAGPPIALMADTFTRFLHPEIGDAALRLLGGHHRVSVVDPGCCGRPQLSAGRLSGARRRLARALDRLAPAIDAGLELVVLEPSCWSMLVDDARRLLPHDSRVGRIADATLTLEQALARLPQMRSLVPGQALVHPHCHVRALGADDAAHALCEGSRDSGAGCCGMAGAFGYQHPELSRRIGELALAPAVRAHDRGPMIAAGSSCRLQIGELTGRVAEHPAVVLDRLARES